MIRTLAAIAGIAALAACTNSPEDRALGGMLVGGAAGALTAEALDANEEWMVVGTLAGATAGALIARSEDSNDRCAYSTGRGTVYYGRCRN